jgi:hypothetical protein
MTVALAGIPTVVRTMGADDFSFVWETSLKVRKPHGTQWRDWVKLHGDELFDSLNAPGSMVAVMESGDVLIGFVHFVGDVLKMIYIKRDLRGFGYGSELLGGRKAVRVWRPNRCFRIWAQVQNIRWREVF